MALIKIEIARVISSCLQKDAFQTTEFSHLKCQLKRKQNWHDLFVKIFQVSADEAEWVNKVNLSSFELKNFFKFGQFVPAWLAREKQNILTSQPCLHTLMQTLLSANQSARTILVVL